MNTLYHFVVSEVDKDTNINEQLKYSASQPQANVNKQIEPTNFRFFKKLIFFCHKFFIPKGG